jgi:hypothetical protein
MFDHSGCRHPVSARENTKSAARVEFYAIGGASCHPRGTLQNMQKIDRKLTENLARLERRPTPQTGTIATLFSQTA